jgi:hypothetical protein
VASFFVSRIDAMVDELIASRLAEEAHAATRDRLRIAGPMTAATTSPM